MSQTLDEVIARLSPEWQERIMARYRILKGEFEGSKAQRQSGLD
ncbi:MAG TPA: hypothetical protein VG798_03980 [Rhizomicrobium sp.]|nr:hypothetical protein [Rhizomicrobium sp.]